MESPIARLKTGGQTGFGSGYALDRIRGGVVEEGVGKVHMTVDLVVMMLLAELCVHNGGEGAIQHKAYLPT